MLRAFRFLALGAFAAAILTAQKSGAPSSPAAPGKGSAPAGAGQMQPDVSAPGPWPGSQLPILLSGTVVIEGGGDVSNIAIQRLCNGTIPRTVAWTDAKGRFSFQWNDSGDVTPQASDPDPGGGAMLADILRSGSANSTALAGSNPPNGNPTGAVNSGQLSGVHMTGCQLQADAPGFRSDRFELSDHRALDNPDLGNIVLHRIGGGKGVSVSATALSAPKDARKAWEKGERLLHSDQPSDLPAAEREFQTAVRIDPKFAAAWLDLGRALERERAEDRARDAFLQAIAADGRQAEPYIALGMAASRRRQWPDAARYLDRALQLNPFDYPHLWYDDAEADYNVGNLDRAEKNLREALKVASINRDPGATKLLGLVLLSKHDYVGAEAALAAYLRKSPDIEDWMEMRAKLDEIRAHLRAKP